MSYNIAVGTVGGGLWVGYNGGDKWRHIHGRIDPDSNVRALALHPPAAAGTNARSPRAGARGEPELLRLGDGGSRLHLLQDIRCAASSRFLEGLGQTN